MTYRDLPELDEFYELERPQASDMPPVSVTTRPIITLSFSDPLARAYWLRWLQTKDCYAAFGRWADARPLWRDRREQ